MVDKEREGNKKKKNNNEYRFSCIFEQAKTDTTCIIQALTRTHKLIWWYNNIFSGSRLLLG